jgi:hypothetical protein
MRTPTKTTTTTMMQVELHKLVSIKLIAKLLKHMRKLRE